MFISLTLKNNSPNNSNEASIKMPVRSTRNLIYFEHLEAEYCKDLSAE